MMLHSLLANKEEFKPIQFIPGMNLILADRAPGATDQHSRNAKGKTSLIQAINYCLGGTLPPSFRPLAEDGWEFTLALDLFGEEIQVTRALRGGSRVTLEAVSSGFPRAIRDYLRDDSTVSLDDWKYLLGLGLFSLDEEPATRGLSSRTLLSYVARLEAPQDPTKIMPQQGAWSSRQHIAYLMGLDWHHTYQLAHMEREEETFEALQRAADERLVPQVIGNESQLVLERSVAEREWQHVHEQLQSFTVLEDPDGTLAESDQVATELNELSNQQVLDQRLLTFYTESLDETGEGADAPQAATVGQLYEELGLTFSREALLRFDQVAEFHRTISSNRKRFLASEVNRIRSALVVRDGKISELNNRRSALLRQLSSGGGVADLLELQSRESDAKTKLAAIDESIRAVRSIQASRDELKVRQATARVDARADLYRDRSFLDAFNVRFDSMIRRLYDRSGSVNVEVDDLGYKFSVKVSGSASSGVTRMQLLCFDLTLMAQSRPRQHPLFLIHDSVVFDGVDPRQVASALFLAREVAEGARAQYIATMNSNDVPEQVQAAPWYDQAVRRTILDTEVGGAFGRAF
jgi:uncharacterized protein YydD (DUF2326 family)